MVTTPASIASVPAPVPAPVIVLVTVNDYETYAVLDAFLAANAPLVQATHDGVTYNDLGLHGGNRVIHTICEMGTSGIGAAAQRTRDAIDHWQPKAIIAVGIAFGVDESQQKIGDVLVASQIQGYELGRLEGDGILTPRADKAAGAAKLINRLRQTNIAQGRGAKGFWPKLRFGLLLSGEKLVDNLDYRQSLRKSFVEAIGGEMEGAGVYASAAAAHVDWLVVKAICDWGHSKNHAKKDAWQQLAAKNAAQVVRAGLNDAGLYVPAGGQHTPAHEQVPAHAPAPAHTPVPAPSVAPAPMQVIVPAPAFPAWALACEPTAQGWALVVPVPWGKPVRVAYPAKDAPLPHLLCQMPLPQQTGALRVSSFYLLFDHIGLMAQLTLTGNLTQIFRYILPGRFVMGSPENEHGRDAKEGPQHHVTISQGFWLADTTCTQAFWQALMGNIGDKRWR